MCLFNAVVSNFERISCRMNRKRCLICWIPLGIFLAILGIILVIVVPVIVSNVVKKVKWHHYVFFFYLFLLPHQLWQKVPLTPGGFSDSVWSRPPYELYMDIWMFNVTNPNEVLHLGAKPALHQMGPYSFM